MRRSVEGDRGLMELVAAALQQPAELRETYLCNICGDNPELLQEATDLLRGEEEMGSFLLHPAIAFQEYPRPFQPGQTVLERFEITREIGEGGMGIVYEAFDRRVHRRIAIKAAKPGFQTRLSPEIESALEVTHPNICRVHEIHTTQTDRGDVDFLTMEFLDGGTLSSYLANGTKIPEPEALEIARQICEGLAEAHRRGIVHRDLKTGNVIVCRNEKNGVRAVITDFGLAGEDAQPCELGGTPRYIAPEIWMGERASRASDIYALGIILCDILTGTSHDSQPLNEFASKLSTGFAAEADDAGPKTLLKGVHGRWARTILRCVDSAPERRPADVSEVLAGLKPPSRLRLVPISVLVVVLAALAFPSVRGRVHDEFWPPPSVRLVVLPASVSAGMAVDSGGALQDASDRISRLTAERRTVAVIPPSKAREMQIRTPEQAQQRVHATHALQTMMRKEGDDWVVTGAVIDLQTQNHLRDFSARYSKTTLGALPEALAGEVSSALDLRGKPSEVISPAATESYDRGLYYLRPESQNVDEAIRGFEEASQLDPRSALPVAGLVEAELDKFDETGAPEHMKQAQTYLQMADNLDPDAVSVHLAAGLFNEARGQNAQAIDQYERVANLEPRNVYALIRIAGVYDKENMPERAITTYRQAVKLDPSFYDPHEYFGVFYFHRGRYEEAAEEFQRVIDLAPGVYNAYTNLGASLEKLGRVDDAVKALQSSLALRETPRALNNMGDLLFSNNRFAEALTYLQRAAALTANDYVILLNLGDTNRHLGNMKEAKADYRKAETFALAELNQNPRSGYPRAVVAYSAARLGDKKRAEDEIGQALRAAPEDNTVIHRAVLTYEVLGLRAEGLAVLNAATPDLLRSLENDPDLAEFCQDSRFRQLVGRNSPQ
ncbi:MAG: protein kinase [Terriglobales bacterium]